MVAELLEKGWALFPAERAVRDWTRHARAAEMATAPMIQQSSHLHVAAGSGQLVFVTTDRDRSCVSMVAAD